MAGGGLRLTARRDGAFTGAMIAARPKNEMHNQQRDAEAPVVSLTEEVEAIRRQVALQRAQSEDTAKRLARLQDQLARKLQSSRNARDE